MAKEVILETTGVTITLKLRYLMMKINPERETHWKYLTQKIYLRKRHESTVDGSPHKTSSLWGGFTIDFMGAKIFHPHTQARLRL